MPRRAAVPPAGRDTTPRTRGCTSMHPALRLTAAIAIGGSFTLATAGTAGAATLAPAYDSAPGHGPSISVDCVGDRLAVGLHPWDRQPRNFQVWSDGRLLVNVNEPEGRWTFERGTVTRLVWVGREYRVDDSDCVTAPSTTTTSTAPATTTTSTAPTTSTTSSSTSTSVVTTTTTPTTSTTGSSTSTSVDAPPTSTTHATTPLPPASVTTTTTTGPTTTTVRASSTVQQLPATGSDARVLVAVGLLMLAVGIGLVVRND